MARIVVALGGNALGNNPQEQAERVRVAAASLVRLIEEGNEIVVSHGNGPQVGMIRLAFDRASADGKGGVAKMPLEICTAMSQGYIGYQLEAGLKQALAERRLPWQVATVLTQVTVSPDDPAFGNPTKPIGAFYDEETARRMMEETPGLLMREDAGRGWRQVVPSPKPQEIIEDQAIRALLEKEFVVVACGGGGIPVVRGRGGVPSDPHGGGTRLHRLRQIRREGTLAHDRGGGDGAHRGGGICPRFHAPESGGGSRFCTRGRGAPRRDCLARPCPRRRARQERYDGHALTGEADKTVTKAGRSRKQWLLPVV